ncbi:MAG: CARDB domain-containing protein [Haloarculaceae archaeon]
MTRDGTTTALLVLVSGLLVISLLSPGIGTVSGQGSPDAAYFYGSAVTEDGTNIPSGTTIKAVTEKDGSNQTVDEITMDTDGKYGGSGLGEEKLEVPGNVDGEVYFIAETGHGSFTAQETVQNPPAGQQQLSLTFPVGSAEPRPYFEISGLTPTDKTAIEGETIDVSATVENIGSEQGSQTIALDINGSTTGTEEVTLDPDASQTVSFTLDTASLGPGNYSHAITSDDDSQSGTLTVEDKQANFTVSGLDPTEKTILEGEQLNASATVTNEGNKEETQTVELRVDGTTLASKEVTLTPSSEETVTFSKVDTASLNSGTFTHGVYTNDDSQTGTLTVESRQASFTVSGLDPSGETITAGAEVAVAANVTNDGNAERTQTVTFQVDGQQYGSEDVTLAPDDRQSVSFPPVDTTELGPGTYTYDVASENDSQSGTLVVESDSPAEFRVTDLTPTDRTVTAGNTYDIAATVRNDGNQEATQQVQYRIDGDTVDRQAVTLASGGQTTVEFTDIEAGALETGTYTHGAYTNNHSRSGTLTVEGNGSDEQDSEATVIVTEVDPSGTTVPRGTAVDVTASVRNEGQTDETQSVQFRLDDERIDSESITLEQGETTTVTFTAETEALAAGTYVYGVHTADDEQVGTLTVEDGPEQTPREQTATPGQSDETTTPADASPTSTRHSPTPAETTTTEDSGGDSGLIPDGLLRAILLYIGVPLAVIYGILKAMAIYLGY